MKYTDSCSHITAVQGETQPIIWLTSPQLSPLTAGSRVVTPFKRDIKESTSSCTFHAETNIKTVLCIYVKPLFSMFRRIKVVTTLIGTQVTASPALPSQQRTSPREWRPGGAPGGCRARRPSGEGCCAFRPWDSASLVCGSHSKENQINSFSSKNTKHFFNFQQSYLFYFEHNKRRSLEF